MLFLFLLSGLDKDCSSLIVKLIQIETEKQTEVFITTDITKEFTDTRTVCMHTVRPPPIIRSALVCTVFAWAQNKGIVNISQLVQHDTNSVKLTKFLVF